MTVRHKKRLTGTVTLTRVDLAIDYYSTGEESGTIAIKGEARTKEIRNVVSKPNIDGLQL